MDEKLDIRKRVQRLKSLPTMPGVVNELLGMVESEDTQVSAIAEIIATDQVLTAKVLRIVNSPFYGFPGRISTINHALVLLGFGVIKGIVVSAVVLDLMADSLVGLWEHSLAVATASDKIARLVKVEEPEEVSTAGLLHDLGKVIVAVEMREESQRILELVRQEKIPFIEAEKRVLDGVTHCQVGGWLAEEWNLSPRLREPIIYHHQPEQAHTAEQPTAIVHLANVLTRALQFGSGGDPYIPQISQSALDLLGFRVGDLAHLLRVVDEALDGLDTADFL
jgi:putative nucleotidyltransferase with HDIG domain